MPETRSSRTVSVAEAGKTADAVGVFVGRLQVQLKKAGLKETQIRELLKAAVAKGDCSSGTMCRLWT